MPDRTVYRLVTLAASAFLFAGCSEELGTETSSSSGPRPLMQHDIVRGPTPWIDLDFGYDPDTVRFGVFADVTGGERDRVSVNAPLT